MKSKYKIENLPTLKRNLFWIWKQGPNLPNGWPGGWSTVKGPFKSKKEAQQALKEIKSPQVSRTESEEEK